MQINVMVLLLTVFMPLCAVVRKSKLIDIQKINPHLRVELAYATADNFTNSVIYETKICFVLQEVAHKLDSVQKELEKMKSKKHPKGLGLKIWDGYRPVSAQKKMWHACAQQYPNEQEREHYVSHPEKGSRCHTRGAAVDVTIIDRATNKELDMGTGFDDFTKKAWRNYSGLSEEVRYNRKLLETVMGKNNFMGIHSEWWHFNYYSWADYAPLDISLLELARSVS